MNNMNNMYTDFAIYFIGSFRNGQRKARCWIRQADERIVHVYDGDVTTNAYSIPTCFSHADFESWVENVYDADKGSDGYSICWVDNSETIIADS